MLGREVDDDDVGHAQIVRQLPEQAAQGVNAARRGADGADRHRAFFRVDIGLACHDGFLLRELTLKHISSGRNIVEG